MTHEKKSHGRRDDDGALIFQNDTGAQESMGYMARVYPEHTDVLLTIGPQHRNRRDVLHGGIIVTVMDSACGYACSRHAAEDAGIPFVTMSLTTNFIAPVAEGTIRATGRVTGGGYKTLFCEAEVRSEDDRLIATATGVFKRSK